MSSAPTVAASASAKGAMFSRQRLVLGALWLTAAAAAWGALEPAVTGASVDSADIVFHVVGASFAACGLLAIHRRPSSVVGPLMVVTAFLFFARPLLLRVDSSLAKTVAFAVTNWWLIFFVALLLSFPGRPRRWIGTERALIGLFVTVWGVLVLAYMLISPFPGNLIAVTANQSLSMALYKTAAALGFAASILVIGLLFARWRVATAPVRRISTPAAVGALTLLALSALELQGVFRKAQSPYLVWPTYIGLLLVPVAFLVGVWRSWAARAAVGDLLVGLGSTRSDPLQGALANALGDPDLVLAYWLPEYGAFVDAHGQRVELPGDRDSRRSSLIEQDGEPVGALVYDASLAEEDRLLDSVVAAAGIALKNERLTAELRAKVEELGASRARIVAAGDQERRRLERNLHDGAQQRLVALSMQLRLLRARIADDPANAEALAEAMDAELGSSLQELRELAHGIHPSALDHGLAVALESLAARSTVPTVVSLDLVDRLPDGVELAVYFVISEALANVAKHARATRATIRVSWTDVGVLVEVADDGVGGASDAAGSGLRGLADRVEALGGQLRIRSPDGGGTTVSAVIPCAS